MTSNVERCMIIWIAFLPEIILAVIIAINNFISHGYIGFTPDLQMLAIINALFYSTRFIAEILDGGFSK